MGGCCLSVTATTGLNILIHSRKIGFEVSMAKSELSDCCKLMSGELIEVWRGSEFRKVEVDGSEVSALLTVW